MNGRSRKRKSFDVAIVGSGPFGWACAQLLPRKNIHTVLIDPHIHSNRIPWTSRGLGVFWPSLNDPPTRAVVAHGIEMARWLQNVCEQGTALVQDFFPHGGIEKIRSLRIGLQTHEIEELDRACQLNIGLKTAAIFEGIPHLYEESSCAYFLRENIHEPSDQVRSQFLTKKNGFVSSIHESKSDCTIHLSSGEELKSEMIILANGFQIATLEPWLSDMLIPMSDVQTHWMTNLPCSPSSLPFSVRVCSGHVAAVFVPSKKSATADRLWSLRMTGPRFLLPSAGAGIDLSSQPVQESLQYQIKQWLLSQLIPQVLPLLESKTEPGLVRVELQSARFGVDCLPCDELPILGDLGHQGRILASTGWLGCGWSAALQSASILSEIIECGRSARLVPLLRPSRWRSGMGDDGVTGMT